MPTACTSCLPFAAWFLLIACANIANLLLGTRSVAPRPDFDSACAGRVTQPPHPAVADGERRAFGLRRPRRTGCRLYWV